MTLNEQIFFAGNSLAGVSPFVDSLIIFCADIVPFIVAAFVLTYFIWIRPSARWLGFVSIATLIAAFVTEILKWVVFRHPRPFVALDGVVQLINISSFDSFPSQYATVFAAIATVVWMHNRRIGVILAIVAIFIGVSRVMAGIHYPLDIAAGWFIGWSVSYVSYRLVRSLANLVKRSLS